MKITGNITHDNSGTKIRFSNDFSRLYNWFIFREKGLRLHSPRYGSKINLYNPKVHTHYPNQYGLDYWVGKKLQVTLHTNKIKNSTSHKGFQVYWMDVDCDNVWEVVKDLGITKNFNKSQRPHITIGNDKHTIYEKNLYNK